MIKFDFETYTKNYISNDDFKDYESKIICAKDYLKNNQDMIGWYHLDELFNHDLITDILNTASYIKSNCDVFLCIGTGGAYSIGISAIEALNPYFYNQKITPAIYYLGTSLSSEYFNDLIDLIKDKDIIINVISKSGTTLETLVTYQLVKNFMSNKYSNEELKTRIIITTDSENGLLREEINREGYKSFIIPKNIGDRYASFTPSGLLPAAVSGINILNLYEGAKEAYNHFNEAFKYAFIRDILYKQGKYVEAFVSYEPKLNSFLEWLKQLYGESLGKEEKGILPISLINTTSLHSLGQFVQEGHKILFETVINIEKSNLNIEIDKYHKSLNEINNIVSESVSKAHQKGNVLNNIITLDELNEYNFGYLIQFFMISCAISGYIEDVNPFNQEGVEEYKNIAREILEK